MKKDLRTTLQLVIYKIIEPFVKLLIKLGITPNMVTIIGLFLNIGVALIFIIGAEKGNRGDFSYVGWAGALVLFAGLFDMLDGQVARLGNMSSSFGALFDSVLDRYSELVLFLGICYYLIAHHYFLSSLVAFIALIGSIMVSYTRARAEGLGIECKGGLMQRPERVVTIGVFALLCGVFSGIIGDNYKLYVPGVPFHIFETMSIFTIPLAVMAVMTNLTAYNRLMNAKRALDKRDEEQKRNGGNKNSMTAALIIITGISLLTHQVDAKPIKQKESKAPTNKETVYPTPKGIDGQLFYLQRNPNTNTIVCKVNTKDGQIDTKQPIHVFWLRYQEQGQQAELNFIQRKFAYGIQAKEISKDKYELRFVSYKKFPMVLMKGERDHKFHVYAEVNKKQIELSRIFVRIEGGSFWIPNVLYVEFKGVNPSTGDEIVERMKV